MATVEAIAGEVLQPKNLESELANLKVWVEASERMLGDDGVRVRSWR